MNSEWQTFLQGQGATFNDAGAVDGFGDDSRGELDAALNGTLLCDLSDLGLIVAEGEEAQAFLQSQFTNDLRTVDKGHGQLSAYCSAKGRMLALFNIVLADGRYYLQMPRELTEQTIKRLQMFILRAKVMLSDGSDEVVRIGLSGSNAESLLQPHCANLPQQPWEVVTENGVTVERLPGALPRFQLYGSREAIEPIWHALATSATLGGRNAWELLDTLAGIPQIYSETLEAFVPQMANLQLVEGVSFRKGCYPGQEIVARMQYLGKLKRRMYLAHVESDTRPLPGSELFDPESESGQGSGKVVRSAPHPDGSYRLLVVTQIASVEADRLQLGSAEGPKLTIESLPYPFEAEGGV